MDSDRILTVLRESGYTPQQAEGLLEAVKIALGVRKHVLFDTYLYQKTLEESGFTEEQAKGALKALRQALDEMDSRIQRDIKRLRGQAQQS